MSQQYPRITDDVVSKAAIAYKDAVKTDAFGDVGDEQYLDAMQAALEAAVPLLAPQPVDREALEKLAARYEDLAGPEREFDEYSIMSQREEARTGAYRLAARELSAVLALMGE